MEGKLKRVTITDGDEQPVKQLLAVESKSSADCYSCSEEVTKNALASAVDSGSLETLHATLQNAVDENSLDKISGTLFCLVLAKKWLGAVKLLLKRGIVPNLEDSSKLAHFAVASKDVELYELLEKLNNLNVREKDEDGLTPLDRAIDNQDMDAVRLMCKFKPLMGYEILSRNLKKLKTEEMTQLILQRNCETTFGTFTIWDAVDCEDIEFIKWYYGAVKNNKDKMERGTTMALLKALGSGLVDISMFLIEQNPAKLSQSSFGWAVSGGQDEIVRKMLEHGYRPNVNHLHKGLSVLQVAIKNENWNAMKLLIQHGVDVTNGDVKGVTTLHLVASKGNCEIVKLLLDRGATADAKDVEDNSVLHYAVLSYNENEEVLELLLRYGADVNVEDKKGRTPLVSAIANKQIVIAKFLIKTIVEMKLDGQLVSEKNWKASEANVELSGHQVQCEREMKSLKVKKFVNSSLSYYSIKKIKDTDQLAALANNKNIFEALKSSEFERDFPIYGRAIVEHFEKGIVRKRGLDRLNAMFFYVACRATDALPKLPITCIHQIFSHLSDQDLDNLMLL